MVVEQYFEKKNLKKKVDVIKLIDMGMKYIVICVNDYKSN